MITHREAEILKLIIQQHTSKEIAILLNISVSTVETHRRHLFQKFGVRNAAGLVNEAMKQGVN
jgi:DNA-binding CsgD family transcriptional regulator